MIGMVKDSVHIGQFMKNSIRDEPCQGRHGEVRWRNSRRSAVESPEGGTQNKVRYLA